MLGCISLLEEIVMQGRELTQFVTDFTWYLRNLMLVKSSDNLEDVIDMSSENLARLKEEANMVEQDQIIRYIRIFSELSGQIKYAAQKRILVEIALIKLCKPEMEVSQEALVDRIRGMEEKLEKGEFAVAPAPQGFVQGQAPKPKPQLPTALPEDIKTAVSSWHSIVGMTDNPMRIHLKGARLSVDAENKLLICLNDGIASDYFTQSEQNREVLQNIISEFLEKKVEIAFQSVKNKREFEETFPDLSSIIGMAVEQED